MPSGEGDTLPEESVLQVQTSKVLDTLFALARETQGATIELLASVVKCGNDDIRSSIQALMDCGLAENDPQYFGRWRLGDRAAELGLSGRYVEMRMLAWPCLQDLHAATGRAVSLHVLEGHWQRAIDACPRYPQSELSNQPLRSYRNGRILRFGSTALVLLAHMLPAEAEAVLAQTARPPSRTEIEQHPQWGHLKESSIDQASWDAASPTLEELAAIGAQGYAVSAPGSRSSMGGHAITAPVFERGGRVCAGLCIFGDRDGGVAEQDDVPPLLKAARMISSQFGHLNG